MNYKSKNSQKIIMLRNVTTFPSGSCSHIVIVFFNFFCTTRIFILLILFQLDHRDVD